MLEATPAAGATLYLGVLILTRFFVQKAAEKKKLLRVLPRPKSFLLSEKSTNEGDIRAPEVQVETPADHEGIFKPPGVTVEPPADHEGIFKPKMHLCVKDSIVIEMLNQQTDKCCFTISDPHLHANPLIFISNAFCSLTGYNREEVILRNCRFLQGSITDRVEVARISTAIREGREGSACLLNYKKNGELFANQLFICPLFDDNHKLVYFLGVQAEVEGDGPGHQPENAGWNINYNV